jgi:hypothetical protein
MTFDTIIDQSAKFPKILLLPRPKMLTPSALNGETDRSISRESFHKAIRFMHDNGWATSNYDEEGEGVLPMVLSTAWLKSWLLPTRSLFAYTATGSGVVAVMNHYASDENQGKIPAQTFGWNWGRNHVSDRTYCRF